MTCGMESPQIHAFVNVRRSHYSRLEGHFTIFIHLFQIKTIFDSKAFCVDSSGSFCPRDATYNPAGKCQKLNPTVILKLLFPKGQHKNPTTIPHSVEEGLLGMLAARAANMTRALVKAPTTSPFPSTPLPPCLPPNLPVSLLTMPFLVPPKPHFVLWFVSLGSTKRAR